MAHILELKGKKSRCLLLLEYTDDRCTGLCSQGPTGSYTPSHMPSKGEKEEEDEEEEDEEQGKPPCAIKGTASLNIIVSQSIRDILV